MSRSCPHCGQPFTRQRQGVSETDARAAAVRQRGTCRIPCPHCGAVVR